MENIKHYLESIQQGEVLTSEQSEQVMDAIMEGTVSDVQIAALLMGLATRGETKDEIVGMLRSMRNHMQTVDLAPNVVDTCGTGGDGHNTFNISTAAALVCAAMGVPVAKHGNRAASSQCGSADLLEAVGIPLETDAVVAKRYFEQHNFVFLYARSYHPAMKHVAAVRKELGVRTIFNFLGPLCNPAGTKRQLIGVSDSTKARVLGEALMELGSERVLVVYSDDGVDEASIAAGSTVLQFTSEEVTEFRVEPPAGYTLADIKGRDPQYNATLLIDLAEGTATPAITQVVAMNAGLALLAAGQVDAYHAGYDQAMQLLQSGELAAYLNSLRSE